jgi:hypothetical protein
MRAARLEGTTLCTTRPSRFFRDPHARGTAQPGRLQSRPGPSGGLTVRAQITRPGRNDQPKCMAPEHRFIANTIREQWTAILRSPEPCGAHSAGGSLLARRDSGQLNFDRSRYGTKAARSCAEAQIVSFNFVNPPIRSVVSSAKLCRV